MDDIASDPDVAHDDVTEKILHWLMRSYESHEVWKNMAQNVFMRSNGDAVLSRCRVASLVRHFCLGENAPSRPTARRHWSVDVPAKVDDERIPLSASNAGYVDWLYVADYLLLRCAALSDEFVEENKQRETEYQQLVSSYELRLNVHKARMILRASPDSADADVLDALKSDGLTASLANVREARRQERAKNVLLEPIRPERPADLKRYTPIYF